MPRSRVNNDPQSFTISPWQQKKKQPRTKDPPEYSQSNFAIKPTLGLHHPTHSIPEVSSKLPPESVEQLCPPATSDQLGPSLVESEAYLVLMDSGSVYGESDVGGSPCTFLLTTMSQTALPSMLWQCLAQEINYCSMTSNAWHGGLILWKTPLLILPQSVLCAWQRATC